MPRIPAAEVDRLKSEVSVVRLIEAAGIALKKHGGKDLVARCPFHDDKTPSLVVTPSKNLWHCLGACGIGGGPIDWVMRWHKVSFRHACDMLLADHPALAGNVGRSKPDARSVSAGDGKQPPSKTDIRAAAQPFTREAGEQAILNQVIDFYHETLLQNPEALDYLKSRGLDDPSLIERYKLGLANRTLAYRLPEKAVKAGAEIRTLLQKLGILRDSGHEHLNGSLVVPLFDDTGNVVQAYGRKIRSDLRRGTPLHLYLPGPHRGVFNRDALANQREIILCESLIDALTFINAGFTNVTTSYGVNGFTPEILSALKSSGAERILIAYDADTAGNQAADELASRLQTEGFACFRLRFPKSKDANAYALEVKPARKSLGLVIRSAEWMGNGKPPIREPLQESKATGKEPSSLAAGVRDAAPEAVAEKAAPTLADELKEVADALADESKSSDPSTPEPDTLSTLPAAAIPEPPQDDTDVEIHDSDIVIRFNQRRYRVRGLEKNTAVDVLKVNILVSESERLHVDTFDLYSAKQRQTFARLAAAELDLDEKTLQRELGRVLLKLETLQEQNLAATLSPKLPDLHDMPADEKAAAMAFLKSPDLIDAIVRDIEAAGLVGEPVNALVGYLAAVSRKLDKPLAIIIQSTSAAGKSALMDAVLDLVPEEDRIHYSAMTGQSLFYLGERDLKHKILAIAEEEGVRQASYALKLLQSQGELTIASTGKDPQSGKLVTEEYRVEGPVMLLLTTTAIDIDEELLNRCLVLTINESREQTRKIQQRQRQQRTLEGLLQTNSAKAIQTLHRNAQRLLRPLAVVNPYAEQLTFLDERTRTRRDHQKYLTLIDVVALLHQHQRSIKTVEHNGQVIEYIEVSPSDIALANRLAHDVLGRSLDELPPQTRQVLAVCCELVNGTMRDESLKRHEVRFTRRDVRKASGLSDTQVRIHLERLVEMEYLITHHGRNGRRFVYELVFDGEPDDEQPRLPGLIDPDDLGRLVPTTADLAGENANLADRLRSANGLLAGSLRTDETAEKPRDERQLDAFAEESAENAHPDEKNNPRSPSRNPSIKSLAAKAS